MIKDIQIDDIFNKWYSTLRDNPSIRYLHKERPELVAHLVSLFVKYRIEYDDAKLYLRQVINALTTAEGRKGRGQYNGWKEAVEQDYLAALANYYIDGITETEQNDIETKSQSIKGSHRETTIIFKGDYIDQDGFITAWCKNRFGTEWTKELNNIAHLVGSYLNLEFMKEVFLSNWVKGKEKAPQWVEKA